MSPAAFCILYVQLHRCGGAPGAKGPYRSGIPALGRARHNPALVLALGAPEHNVHALSCPDARLTVAALRRIVAHTYMYMYLLRKLVGVESEPVSTTRKKCASSPMFRFVTAEPSSN